MLKMEELEIEIEMRIFRNWKKFFRVEKNFFFNFLDSIKFFHNFD